MTLRNIKWLMKEEKHVEERQKKLKKDVAKDEEKKKEEGVKKEEGEKGEHLKR